MPELHEHAGTEASRTAVSTVDAKLKRERVEMVSEITNLRAERDRAVESRENANALTLRVEAERDRYRRQRDELGEALHATARLVWAGWEDGETGTWEDIDVPLMVADEARVVVAERDGLRHALEDLIERQWDFPTDLTSAEPGWAEAYANAARLLLATNQQEEQE